MESTGGEIEVIENGALLVQAGKLLAVGPRSEIEVPENSVLRDLSGKYVMPGLVDTHTHIGDVTGGDSSDPIQPEVRALDSIDVRHPSLQRARAGGITTVNIMPGSGHLISGQTIYLKLRKGNSVEELVVRNGDGSVAGGLKMANGTNSQRRPPFPGSRAKSAALVRQAFVAAQDYGVRRDKALAQQAASDNGNSKPFARDLANETLLEVLAGQRVVHHHTHRHDDVLTVLRLSKEFGFRVVLHHVSDAWKIADEIATAGAPCSLIMIDSPGGKLEARDLRFENGAALERAGAEVAYHTDDYITDSRVFLRSPALAVRAGMSRQGALSSVTLSAAKMIDLDQRIGSLKVGKDADFIVLDGDPLSVSTHVLETWIEGERVFDRSNPEDLLVAEGGYGAGDPHDFHGCCNAP